MPADMGHNNPPEPIEALKEKLALYKEGAEAFGPVTEANAQEYRDHIGYGVKLAKEIDGQRETEKKPHLEAGRAVDAAYKPLLETVEATQKKLKAPLQSFIVEREKEAKRIADEKAKALREAEEAARKAAEEPEEDPFLAATAPTVDLAAAKVEAKVAELQVSAASRVSSAAGGFNATSLKTVRKANVTDYAALIAHYASHYEVKDAALKLANADIRHAKGAPITIPGVEIVEERVL